MIINSKHMESEPHSMLEGGGCCALPGGSGKGTGGAWGRATLDRESGDTSLRMNTSLG